MAKVGKFCLAKRVKVEWLFQCCGIKVLHDLNSSIHL